MLGTRTSPTHPCPCFARAVPLWSCLAMLVCVKVRQYPAPSVSCAPKVSSRRYRMQTWNWGPIKELYTHSRGSELGVLTPLGLPVQYIEFSSCLSVTWFLYSQFLQRFLYSSSLYSFHLFLISSASVRSILFLSFFVPIFAWNVTLVSLIFLKRSLVFPILLIRISIFM